MSSSHWDDNYEDMNLRELFSDARCRGGKYKTEEDRDKFRREINGIRREFDEEFNAYGYPKDGNYFDLED